MLCGMMGGKASAAVTYSISGIVSNGNTAIAGATVALGAYSAISGADGTFTITGIPAGTSGSLTSTLAGQTFYPANISIPAMSGNLTCEDKTR
jgi:di/tricarboxylate transporter